MADILLVGWVAYLEYLAHTKYAEVPEVRMDIHLLCLVFVITYVVQLYCFRTKK